MFEAIKDFIFEIQYKLKHLGINQITFSDHKEYIGETISLENAKNLWLPKYEGERKDVYITDTLYGAIFGDIAGSRYEFSKSPDNYETIDLICDKSFYTDDTILSVATKYAIENNLKYDEAYHKIGNIFRNAGYGSNFSYWLNLEKYKPYYSYGNGSAMRVSYIGSYFIDKDNMFKNAYLSAAATHNHKEGIKGAVVTASCIWMIYQGANKDDIYDYVKECYPELDNYKMENVKGKSFRNVDCMVCVPLAVKCFLESNSIEECMRNVLSFNGDTDTIGAIACSIAAAYYGFDNLEEKYKERVNKEYVDIYNKIR